MAILMMPLHSLYMDGVFWARNVFTFCWSELGYNCCSVSLFDPAQLSWLSTFHLPVRRRAIFNQFCDCNAIQVQKMSSKYQSWDLELHKWSICKCLLTTTFATRMISKRTGGSDIHRCMFFKRRPNVFRYLQLYPTNKMPKKTAEVAREKACCFLTINFSVKNQEFQIKDWWSLQH